MYVIKTQTDMLGDVWINVIITKNTLQYKRFFFENSNIDLKFIMKITIKIPCKESVNTILQFFFFEKE